MKTLDLAALNYSVGVLQDGPEAKSGAIRGRVKAAGKLVAEGIQVGLYVRPVVPGKTLQDIAEISRLAFDQGITRALVGDLYVDSKITERMHSRGVKIPAGRKNGRMIMDREGLLEKVDNPEVLRVKEELKMANLYRLRVVFRPSLVSREEPPGELT